MVADNKVPLFLAVQVTSERRRRKHPERWWVGSAILFAGLMCVAMMVHAERAVRGDQDVSGSVSQVPVQDDHPIRRNSRGELTQIVAPTPLAVLETFCASLGEGARAVRVVPGREHWLGFYRQYGLLRTIAIEKDPQQEGWLTGDASAPIVAGSRIAPG